MNDGPLLAGGLIRRMAHDLSSPLAALQAIAELGSHDPSLQVAIDQLSQRLSLYRALFGGNPDVFPVAEAGMLLAERLGGLGHRMVNSMSDNAAARDRRAAMVLALVAGDRLVGGGQIFLRDGPRVELRGRYRAPDAALVTALAGKGAGNPGDAAAAFVAALVGPLKIAATDKGMVFFRTGH